MGQNLTADEAAASAATSALSEKICAAIDGADTNVILNAIGIVLTLVITVTEGGALADERVKEICDEVTDGVRECFRRTKSAVDASGRA